MPPSSRGAFRPREKTLILLVLATFSFVCFGAIFFLPDKGTPNANKVEKVYRQMKEQGLDFIIPPPPIGNDNPNVRHGVIDRPDPHQEEDRAKLLAQIEMDSEINEMRKKQRVLEKPRQSSSSIKTIDENEPHFLPNDVKKPNKQPFLPDEDNDVISRGYPVIVGGEDSDPEVKKKRDTVKGMMRHAWDNYVKFAWGANELRPISRRGHTASIFGSSAMGATIIDALDTLYIMGMHDEFAKGREWIEQYLDLNHMSGDISVFETNIRYVGGLLTAYALSGDELFKEKAAHVANKLLPAFNTPTGIPYALVNMRTGTAKNFGWASGGSSILSEFGTLHMEFAYLSDITGSPKYREKVEKIREVISEVKRPKSLYPNYLNPKTGKWGQQHTSVGALGDSFYEYLLKEWIRSGKKDVQAKELMDEALTDIENQLVKVSNGGLTYIAEYKFGRLEHKMDHLACFAGGMYGLAAHEEQDANSARWMRIAQGITHTCHESYDRSDTKLGPEAFRFSDAIEARALKQNERYYILRPETVESYFVMWRLTHDQKYRDWGWEAVQALERHCRTDNGYSGIKNVYQVDGQKDDVQQSFLLAETLKYLYLLFSDDSLISLDHWVFNTEAHPLPIKGKNNFYRGASTV